MKAAHHLCVCLPGPLHMYTLILSSTQKINSLMGDGGIKTTPVPFKALLHHWLYPFTVLRPSVEPYLSPL